jgi:hypothetical protein
VAVVSVIVFFFSRSNKSQTTVNPDANQSQEASSDGKLSSDSTATEIAFPGLEQKDDYNYLNTVTTTDSLGRKYRLVMIGDKRPEFYINDSLQSNQEPYDGLIGTMAKELWRRQKEAEKK